MPLPKNNPVRHLLEASATGNRPSARDLEMLDRVSADLPPGEGLSALKPAVNSAAAKVAKLGGQGNHAEARRLADELASDIAERMSDSARALNTTAAQGEPLIPAGNDTAAQLDDFARRMFGN